MYLPGTFPSQHTAYQLHIQVSKNIQLAIGALGQHRFVAGYYVYTGSAKWNMKARLKRHLSNNKKLHWHIDYLLIHPQVTIRGIKTYAMEECVLNQKLNGQIVIPGFGASDCRNQCHSHLKYIPTNPAPEKL